MVNGRSRHDEDLLVDRDGAVAIVTLDRPERLNALSHGLLARLLAVLQGLDADDAVRAVVLTGAGRAFSSGADLRGGPSDAEHTLRSLYHPLVLHMRSMRVPLVAAVNGVAAGAAVSLVLACDLVVMGTGATVQLPFVRLGLVPDAGALWWLARLVGPARTAELVLLGDRLSAAEALTWGLANRVADDCLATAVSLAQTAAANSSSTGPIRTLLYDALARDLPAQLDAEATVQGRLQHGADYVEARHAFAEKRPPVFASVTVPPVPG